MSLRLPRIALLVALSVTVLLALPAAPAHAFEIPNPHYLKPVNGIGIGTGSTI